MLNCTQLSINIWKNIITVTDLFSMLLCNIKRGFYVLLLKTKWGMNRITKLYGLHKIYSRELSLRFKIPSLDNHSSTCRVFWGKGSERGR